jgi:hypothetical protein
LFPTHGEGEEDESEISSSYSSSSSFSIGLCCTEHFRRIDGSVLFEYAFLCHIDTYENRPVEDEDDDEYEDE